MPSYHYPNACENEWKVSICSCRDCTADDSLRFKIPASDIIAHFQQNIKIHLGVQHMSTKMKTKVSYDQQRLLVFEKLSKGESLTEE